MNKCNVIGVNAPEKIKEIIEKLANGDVIKASVMYAISKSKSFRDKLAELKINLTENGDLDGKGKANEYSKQLNNAYINHVKKLSATVAKEQGDSIFNFSSAKAFSDAQLYTAYLISKRHRENEFLPKEKRLTKEGIIRSVIKEISENYRIEVANSLINRLKSGQKNSKAYKDFVDKITLYNETVAAYEVSNNNLKEENKKLNDLKAKRLELEKIIKKAKADKVDFTDTKKELDNIIKDIENKVTELKTAKSKVDEIRNKLETREENGNVVLGLIDETYAAIDNFIEKYGNNIEKNYANLVSLSRQNNGVEWFTRVFLNPTLSSLLKDYKSILNNLDSSVETNVDLDEDFVNIQQILLDNDIHDTGWDRDYKSFLKAVDGTIRAYFNSLPKLLQPAEQGKDYIYDRSNELGVVLPDDGTKLFSQVLVNASYNSVEDFIASIEKLSRIPGLYSLAIFADDLKTGKINAKYFYSQLKKPVIKKAIVNVSKTGLNFTQSNVSVDAVFHKATKIVNDYKITHDSAINVDDLNKIKSLLERIAKSGVVRTKTDQVFKLKNIRDLYSECNEVIKDILGRYMPSVTSAEIDNMLNDGSDTVNNIYTTVLKTIANFVEAANQTENILLAAKNEYNEKYAAYAKTNDLYAQGLIPKRPIAPTLNITDKEYANIWKTGIELSAIICKNNAVNIRLNTPNAAGNMSSDPIANSRVTNLMNMISDYYMNNNDELMYPQLEILRQELESRPYYKYSTIFYGIPGTNIEGLFIKQEDGSTIVNPRAKDVLDFYLFDGAIDRANNASSLYGNMFKGDYFLCMMSAYMDNGEETHIKRNSEIGNRAGYFLRVPSDASKNFIAYGQKIKLGGLEYANEKSVQEYIANFKSEFEAKLDGEHVENKRKYPKLISAEEAPKHNFGNENNTDNQITAEEFYELITKGTLNNSKVSRKQFHEHSKLGDKGVKIVLFYGTGENRVEVIITANQIKETTTGKYAYNNIIVKGIISKNKTLPKQIFRDLRNSLITKGLAEGKITTEISREHDIVTAFVQHLKSELNLFVSQLNVMFDINGDKKLRTDINGLFDYMHHKKGAIISKDGKRLEGNAFKFIKLFDIEDINVQEEFESVFLLYGQDNDSLIVKDGSSFKVNTDRTNLITKTANSKGKYEYLDSIENEQKLRDITVKWLKAYIRKIENSTSQYNEINDGKYNRDQIVECILNTYLNNLMFDDILEGDAKYYKDAQTELKRAKENQMGGVAFANMDLNMSDDKIVEMDSQPITIKGNQILSNDSIYGYEERGIRPRNGFRAVTIYNTEQASKNADVIEQDIYNNLISKGISEKVASKIAKNLSDPFRAKSCVNDAQSFITIEEYIRRREANGTLHEVEDTIAKLLDPNVPLSEINPDDLGKIQVEKNVYYDIAYDENTGLPYPRQIKNAEFVLIPRLIKGSKLEELYNIMKRQDIGQVNTVETSKAANKTIFEFFGKNDSEWINPNFEQDILENQDLIENYYYRNFYKQLEVHEHTRDKTNKVGIQMFKKMIDNYHIVSPEVREHIDEFIKYYVYNIQDSFNTLLEDLGWKYQNGKIVNKDGSTNLDISEYYERLKEECARLGLDSNFMDYVTLDETGQPVMPNFMNLVSTKFENIIQAIFNSYITRQELPGWHGVQVTSVGAPRKLAYHPSKLDEHGNTIAEGYIEVMLPRWSKLIPKYKPSVKNANETQEEYNARIEKERKEFDENILKQLADGGIDIHLGYRIPTEGKQSISVLKVVGFTDDALGSTVILPEEWVAQTGADFDVDSVFGVCYAMYIDKDGKLQKYKLDLGTEEIDYQRRYLNYIKHLIKVIKRTKLKNEDFENAFQKAREQLDINSPIFIEKESYDKLKEKIKEIRKSFPNKLRTLIIEKIKEGNEKEIDNVIINNDIKAIVESYANESNNQLLIEAAKQHNELLQEVTDFINRNREYYDENYFSHEEIADELKKENWNNYFNQIKQLAAECQLMSYEEFKKLPIELQQDKRARNNHIVENLIAVLSHVDSHEENYSRSNFEDMTEADKKTKEFTKSDSVVRSVYDPLNQLENFNNAAAGRQLKGISVMRDNFLSVANKGRAVVPSSYAITVVYDLSETNLDGKPFVEEDIINECYETGEAQNGKFTVTHNKYGWSSTIKEVDGKRVETITNRNVTGKLLTAYSSQTSAQTFDIIKEGSIDNIDTYTFPIFKTLIDMGIDYYTAILFIKQPAITEIVKANTEKNSIFANKTGNPIEVAIKRMVGRKIGGISEYSPLGEVLQKANIAKQYSDINLKLDVAELVKQLQNPTYHTQLLIACMFKKLMNFANELDKIVKVSNPDKFGAKQSIYENREVLKSIKELKSADTECVLYRVKDDGTLERFIDGLYPTTGSLEVDDINIDVQNSFYPHMAAFMQYSTIQSVRINKDIYELENDKFDYIWEQLKHELGVDGTLKMNKAFKKYIINYAFNQTPVMQYPLTINKDGFVGYDESRIKDNSLEDVIDLERLRVYGYGEDIFEDFELADYNNPTQEEINKFNKYTPVEKVIYIQKHLKEAPLFEILDINVYTGRTAEEQGRHPSITYNDQTIDKESAIMMFKDAYYNKHPFIKLAAIDLIKYAFIVEGNNFKNGSISKIIPNTCIRNRIEDWGLNMIESVRGVINDVYFSTGETFIEKFIRSHKQFADRVYIPKPNRDKNKPATLGNILENNIPEDGNNFVQIARTSSNDKLLERLGLLEYNKDFDIRNYMSENDAIELDNAYKAFKDGNITKEEYDEIKNSIEEKYSANKYNPIYKRYIVVSKYDAVSKRHIDTLYLVEVGESGKYYLIPLNEIEENETANYSINNFNNKYERKGSYLGYIYYIEDQTETAEPYVFNYENVDRRKTGSELFENPNALVSLTNSADNDVKAGSTKLVKGITQYFEENKGLDLDYAQINNNESLKRFKIDISSTQNIEINGVETPFNISRSNAAKIFGAIIKHKEDIFKLQIDDNTFIEPRFKDGTIIPKNYAIYKALMKIQDGYRESFKEAVKLLQSNPNMKPNNIIMYIASPITINTEKVKYEDDNMFESAYDTIGSIPVESDEITSEEILAQKIYNALKDGSDLNELVAERFIRPLSMKGVNPRSSKSIRDNMVNIYKSGLNYYQEKARIILNEIKEFRVSTGETFKIHDPALYDYLLNSNNESDINKLIKLLLEATNFGKLINDVYDLPVEGENQEINHTIQELKYTISKVKDNSSVTKATELLFNKVYGAKLSTNPLVKVGLISITESFHDTNFMDLHFSNIAEINNKEIQIILKHMYAKLESAKFSIDDKIQEWRTKYDEIMSMSGSYNEANIIDENGVITRQFTDEFIQKKDELIEKIHEAERIYGRHSKEFELATLDKLEWYAKNVEQEYDKEYYDDYNANLREILTSVPEYYLKYKALIKELGQLTGNYAILTTEDRRRIREINREIDYMSRVDSAIRGTTEEEKALEAHNKAQLARFIKRRREINKKYFDYIEDENFKETLEKNLDIIKNYEEIHGLEPLERRLENKEYRDAYDWIHFNSFYRIDPEVSKAISNAFTALSTTDGAKPNHITQTANAEINFILENAKNDLDRKVVDEYGIFHPERLTDEEIEAIKDIVEDQYIGQNHPLGSALSAQHENDALAVLIKDIPNDLPTYKASVYEAIKKNKEDDREGNVRRGEIIAQINNLIKYGINRHTGKLSSKLLFETLSDEQLNKLADLYEELESLQLNEGGSRTTALFKHKRSGLYIGLKPNEAAFNTELNYYQNHLANTNAGALWLRIFTENRLDDGSELRPNLDIYGYFFISNERGDAATQEQVESLIDRRKTDAKTFIRENLEYVEVEGYHIARQQAIDEGRFKEWFDKNHYFDPYTHTMKPLKIWTTMKIKETSPLANKGFYVQKDATLSRKILDAYKNNNYKPESRGRYTQYKLDTGEYRNAKYDALSDKEKAMIEHLQNTHDEFGKTREAQVFFGKGYIPRLRMQEDIDSRYIGKQIFGLVGLEAAQVNQEWKAAIDYTNDKDADFDMTRILKGKGSKKHEEEIKHSDFETSEEYDRIEKENEEIRKRNKEIDKQNKEIDKKLLTRDIKSVYETFISKAIVYNTKAELKNLGYLVQEDLRNKKSYKQSRFTGDLIKNHKLSTETRNEYYRDNFDNTLEIFENWFRRFFFDEYKKGGNLSTLASVLQNITSAKYMQFNVTGGIANVGTGFANILGEGFARDYFDNKDLAEATARYFKAIPHILASMYSDTSSNLDVALFKKFNIVNYEEMLERRNGESVHEYVQRVRDLTYGLQAGGEHFMQNTALLAMLKSHRVVTINGKTELYTFNRYINNIENIVFEDIINKNSEAKIKYQAFIKKIKSDAKLRSKYDKLKANYVIDFIKEYTHSTKDNTLLEKYLAAKKEAIKHAKEDFETNPQLISQFELSPNKTAVLKSDSKVTEEMLGQFKSKVIRVNEKIHGNYSKLGAARIEAEWWGGLVMQYHKHLYPGIMKRYRFNGMYNELRESFEKGSYVSIGQFLTTEFKGIASRIKDDAEEKDTMLLLAGIQEVFKALVDTATHMKLNWQLLPEWEKNNIRRAYGDLCGIAGSISLAIALHMATDEDEIKDSNLLSTILYVSDRLFSESRMYTPLGLYSEASTLWSSPIAARNSIGDALKLMSIGVNVLFDEDFDINYTTGLYKGDNKAWVILRNNIPIYRNINRLQRMAKNNSYYRINDNARNIKFSRNIADAIVPE